MHSNYNERLPNKNESPDIQKLIQKSDNLLNSPQFRVLAKIDITTKQYTLLNKENNINPIELAKIDREEITSLYQEAQQLFKEAQLAINTQQETAQTQILKNYLNRLRNLRTYFRLLLTLNTVSEEEKGQLVSALKNVHNELYEADSRESAYNALQRLKASDLLSSALPFYSSEETRDKLQKTLTHLNLKKSTHKPIENIPIAEFDTFKDDMESQFNDFIPTEIEQEFEQLQDTKVRPERQIEIVQTILQNMNQKFDQTWQVKVRTGSKAFMVEQATKTVMCPDPEYTGSDISLQNSYKGLKGLIYHELFTHVLRGMQSEFRLPEYLDAEEGVALVNESIAKDNTSIKLGGVRVRGVLFALHDLGWNMKELIELTEALNKAEEANGKKDAYTSTISRMIRGGYFDSASQESAIFQKDRAYARGLDIVYSLVQNTKSSDPRVASIARIIQQNLLKAKFDPSNYEHVLFLAEKEILPLTKEDVKYYFAKATA